MKPVPLRIWPLGCLVAVAALCPAAAVAQPQPSGPNVSLVGKNMFSLPVLLEQSAINNLRDIELYVRRKQGDPWKLTQTIKPTEKAFVFKAGDDGEYQFAVVGVDRQGRRSAPNLALKLPDSVIAVDTQAPQINLVFAGDTVEGMHVNCKIADANSNPFATEFHYQTQDTQWQRLLPQPNQPDRYCIPQAAALSGLVKIAARDRAGNQSLREFNLGQARQEAGLPPNTRMPYAERTPPSPTAIAAEPRTIAEPGALVLPQASNDLLLPNAPPPTKEPVFPKADATKRDNDALAIVPPEPPPALPKPNTDYDTLRVPTAKSEVPPPLPLETPSTLTADATRQFINRPRVYLAYEIEHNVANNPNKIQIWLSNDHGHNWSHAGDDLDGKSPAEIRLPHEGVTGVRLVAGTHTPGATSNVDDSVVSWIELDVTKPVIEMSVRREPGALSTQWSVREKNPATDPVDMYYAVDPQGPWLAIAGGLSTAGEYRWEIPAHLMGKTLHVRVTASDAAGNIAQADQAVPMTAPGIPQVVEPTTPPAPRVRFLGVSSSPQATP